MSALAALLRRAPAGAKLAALAIAGTGVMAIADWRVMVDLALLAALAFRLAGCGTDALGRQLRPMLWMLAALFLVQGWLVDWATAALVVARIVTLVLLAALVTLTTPAEAMIATIERLLAPFVRFGVDPGRVGLAFSLALRFIPVIGEEAERVREAQAARGLGHHPLALILPLIVRVLKSAEDVAAAIEARSGHDDPGRAAPSRSVW
ncbi:energy-coupling factor transporter transmembrane component T family protein [Rhodobacter maris]|uniref:Biotin transport system permease protein n=1 Tax=Rhodobacter maris TaxID=446682 RepID=A0A285TBP3_9RHOB|nr:energy-coupling factor transporter transmembrane protein EcfT [Rhodobacter maris]SOC19154.1 biotin transport system permease protein [Rhodobacter maris]